LQFDETLALRTVQYAARIVYDNLFLNCFAELNELRALVDKSSGSSSSSNSSSSSSKKEAKRKQQQGGNHKKKLPYTVLMKMNPRKGTIKLSATTTKRGYTSSCTYRVPPDYPQAALVVHKLACNFELAPNAYHQIPALFKQQAETLALRLHSGIPLVRAAKKRSDLLQDGGAATAAAAGGGGSGGGEVPLVVDSKHLAQVKRDVNYLKHAQDLRDESHIKEQRRKLKRLEKKELATMEAERQEALERKLASRRGAFAAVADDGTGDGDGAGDGELNRKGLPSLLHVALDMWQRFQLLPLCKCQVCKRLLFPARATFAAIVASAPPCKHAMYPFVASCGHWFHRRCLKESVSSPPFTPKCAECGARYMHKLFSADVAKLEKRWAAKQAHARELAEIRDFMLGN
jgi:hypothetical protein